MELIIDIVLEVICGLLGTSKNRWLKLSLIAILVIAIVGVVLFTMVT